MADAIASAEHTLLALIVLVKPFFSRTWGCLVLRLHDIDSGEANVCRTSPPPPQRAQGFRNGGCQGSEVLTFDRSNVQVPGRCYDHQGSKKYIGLQDNAIREIDGILLPPRFGSPAVAVT